MSFPIQRPCYTDQYNYSWAEMKTDSRRAPLKRALEKSFLPLLREKGFSGPLERLSGNCSSYEYSRKMGAVTQTMSIQFEKRKKPRFVINFNEQSPGGVDLLLSGRLQPRNSPSLGAWFRSDPHWIFRLFGYRRLRDADLVISELIHLFPQVEHWWNTKEAGPNLRVY